MLRSKVSNLSITDGTDSKDSSSKQEPQKFVDIEVAEMVGLQAAINDESDAVVVAVDPQLVDVWTKMINSGLNKEEKASLLDAYHRYMLPVVIAIITILYS